MKTNPKTIAHNHRTPEFAVSVHTTRNAPDHRSHKPAPDLNEPLWTNAHLCRYLGCGTTTLAQLKHQEGFPQPALIGGLQRYFPEHIRAWACAQIKDAFNGTPSRTPTTAITTTEGTAQ